VSVVIVVILSCDDEAARLGEFVPSPSVGGVFNQTESKKTASGGRNYHIATLGKATPAFNKAQSKKMVSIHCLLHDGNDVIRHCRDPFWR
jgi:hypothetical protein